MKKIRRSELNEKEWRELEVVSHDIAHYPLLICDKGGLSINEITSISKAWKIKYQVEAIYIDYLQLITTKEKRFSIREQEVAEISRRLKTLAKDLEIPVIALAQLNRSCESRSDKRPLLSDLRESGSIEQDADLVIFPFRPELYDDNAEKGLCELIIAKQRNGVTGIVNSSFNGETQSFDNYES